MNTTNLEILSIQCSLAAINLRALAMVAANQERLIRGESLAYPEEAFRLVEQEAIELHYTVVDKLRNIPSVLTGDEL